MNLLQIGGGGKLFWYHGMAFMYFPQLTASRWNSHQMPPDGGGAGHGGKRNGSNFIGHNKHHITFLEMVAVMLACMAWGPQWQGRLVHVWYVRQCTQLQLVPAETRASCTCCDVCFHGGILSISIVIHSYPRSE